MKEIHKSLMEFQKKFKGVEKDKQNDFTKSWYATLDSVVKSVTKILNDEGVFIYQPLIVFNGIQQLETNLIHADSGEKLTSVINLSELTEKATAQGFGSAVTYGRRYALCSMLNIAEADDDGNQQEDDVKNELIKKINIYGGENHTEIELFGFIDNIKNKYGEEMLSFVMAGIDKGMKTKTSSKMSKGRQQYFDYLNIFRGDDTGAIEQAESELTDLELKIIKGGLK